MACEPPFGVPSMMNLAPGWRHMRAHVAWPAAIASMVRTTSPPIECASSRTGWFARSGEREHRVDRVAQQMRRGASSGCRQS